MTSQTRTTERKQSESTTRQIEAFEKVVQAITVALLGFCVYFLTRALSQLDTISDQVARNTTSIAVLTVRMEALRQKKPE